MAFAMYQCGHVYFWFFGQPVTMSSDDSFSFNTTVTYKDNQVNMNVGTYSDLDCQASANITVVDNTIIMHGYWL